VKFLLKCFWPNRPQSVHSPISSKGGIAEPTHPGGRLEAPEVSLLTFANCARAYAAMPRISMMVFLSQYDKLRERRGRVQD
jgi:hypothetical protein